MRTEQRPLRELYASASREAMEHVGKRNGRLRHLRAIRGFRDFRGWPVLPGRCGDVTPGVAEKLIASGIARGER